MDAVLGVEDDCVVTVRQCKSCWQYLNAVVFYLVSIILYVDKFTLVTLLGPT
jgi:hypothetical protein